MQPAPARHSSHARRHRIGPSWLAAFALAATVAITTGGGGASVGAQTDPADVTPATTVPTTGDTEPDEPTSAASAFQPINPIRVLDTRRSSAMPRLWVESAISLDPVTDTGVADAAGVDPSEVTAVVVNVTMINAGSAGFGSVWPTGTTRLQTSTNNVEFAGHTIPNLVIAPLGLEGKISLFASTTSDLTVDVLGVFTRSDATTAGRYESIDPTRAFDTRRDDTDSFESGERREVDLTDAGVPVDATAVVMNVTAIRSNGAGFYRVWSAGEAEPQHSSVNVLGVDYQAGNQVISGVQDGTINVSTNVGGGLTIDVTGYFTGEDPEAEPTTEGLYVPITPGRLLDSRATSGTAALTEGARLDKGDAVDIEPIDRLDLPSTGIKAVALNLTAVRADARGFVSVFASDADVPATSSLNFTTGGQTVPNHAITTVGASGSIRVISSENTNLLIDAAGYFLDAGATPPTEPSAAGRSVEPREFVPEALASSVADGPYDFLFDRGAFTATGVRPTPPIRAVWPTCEAVRYAINIDLAENDEQVAVLIESIEEMELYTGLDFQYAGVTSSGMNIDNPILLAENFNPELEPRQLGDDPAPFKYLPPDPNGNDSVSLVIGFSNNADTIELRSAGTIGVGGSLRTNSDPITGFARALRGFALIDLTELYSDGPDGPGTLANIKATTTHELGHMMGLGHVSDFDPRTRIPSSAFQGLGPNSGLWSNATVQDQLMYPSLNPSAGVNFDIGDQRGLWELYNQEFCPAPLGNQKADASASSDADIDWSTVEVVKSDDDFG